MTSWGLAAVSSSFFAALYSAFGRYDVVHIHAEGPAFFAWLPKMFGKRVVVTVHGIDCVLQRKDRKSIAITPCTAEHPMSFKVPDRLLTDGQCRMMINGIQFIQALLEANELAVGKDHQFKGRYEAEKNAVIISLEKDEREW